jgi:hypothetical protein
MLGSVRSSSRDQEVQEILHTSQSQSQSNTSQATDLHITRHAITAPLATCVLEFRWSHTPHGRAHSNTHRPNSPSDSIDRRAGIDPPPHPSSSDRFYSIQSFLNAGQNGLAMSAIVYGLKLYLVPSVFAALRFPVSGMDRPLDT